jgi:hypothetical protein
MQEALQLLLSFDRNRRITAVARLSQPFFPGTLAGGNARCGSLHRFLVSALANPHDSLTRLLSVAGNSNPVA